MSSAQPKPAAPKGFVPKEKPRGPVWYIGVLLSLLFMFFFGRVIKPWSTVTPLGVNVIGVFIGTLVAVVMTNDLLWPALMAMFALVVNGFYASGTAAIAALFGNSTVFQFVIMQCLIRSVIDSGAGEVLARMILTRKFIQKKPLLLTFIFFITFVIASNIMAAFGCIFLAFPILKSFLTQAGYSMKDKYSGFMYTGTFIAAMTGAAVKTTVSAGGLVRIGYFNTALADLGISVDHGQHTLFVILILLVFYIVYTFAIKYLFRADLSKLKNTDFRKMEGMMDNLRFNKYQVTYLVAFLLFVLYSVFVGFFPKDWAFTKTANAVGLPVWGAFICVVLSFIRMKDESGKKKPIFNIGRNLKSGVSWDMLFILGAFTVLGGGLSANNSGVKQWLSIVFTPVFEGKSPLLFVLLIILLSTVVTNFFSNIATGTIFAAIAAPLCVPFVQAGLNPAIISVGISISASFAFLTYASCGPAPLLLDEEAADPKFIWSYGVATVGLYIVVCTAMLMVCNLIW